VVYNNELIIMNGWQKNNTGSQSIQEQYRLSLAENVWRKEAKPPVWVIAGNTFIIGDTFYAYTHTIYGNPSLHAYHLPSGKWTYKISAPFNSSTHSFRIDKSAYFISSKEVWRFDPEDYVATPSDLVSEMKNGRFLIHWKNNSTKPVKVILQQTGVSINPVTIAEVQGNLETYNFKNYKQNHHYYIRAIAVSEQGAYSEFTNTTTLHTGPYWTKVGDLPMAPRQYSILQAANNNLYYGLGEAGSVFYNDLWMYDEVTGVWTQKADFPGKPRSRANTFVIQNQLYAGLGSGSTGTYQDMYKYNAATNEWIASVDFPKAGYRRMGVFVHNNAAYFAGGQVSTANSSVELYRFNGTSWTELSSIPGDPRADPLTFVYNGKAYIGGGEKIENGWYSGTREFFEYDISTGTWKKLNDLPSELHINYPMFGYTLSDGAYIFGLRSNGSGIIAYKYKAASDTWEPASLTHLYPGYFVQTQMVRTDNGLAFGVVPFGNGRELWRFDPMINGPEIVELRNPSTGRVTIKWRRIIPQPDSVGIERSETVDGAFLETLVIKTSDTTATDVVPESGKEYFYRVKAYRGHGYVKRSPYKSINVAPAPPGPALIATYTGGAISLSWTAIQNNSIYTVERSVNDEPFEELLSTSSTSTQDIVTGEHKYSYRVYTKNPETRRSNTVTILITGSEDNEYSLPIRVYPNPAVDQLIITLPESRIQTGVIHDQTGKVVCHVQLQREAVLDVSLFKPGLYFITLKGNTADKQRVIKFIKK
jgi:N-acetylneuraminic acid mutarotase